MEKKVDISLNIIIRVLAVAAIVTFLYLIREVIALFLVAVIITAALNPVIRRVQAFNCSRALAVMFVYLVFFTTLGLIISLIMPTLVSQFEEFVVSFPDLMVSFFPESYNISEKIFSADLGEKFVGSLGNIFSKAGSFVQGVISVVAIISMSFYMSLQENGLKQGIVMITPRERKDYVASLVDRIYQSFGRWMMGQIITMFFVGILYFIALYFLGVPYVVVLALIGGLLEIIPYFGPIVAGIPAIILGFTQGPVIGMVVIVAYLLINIIENHFLVPKIMNKAVGLSPVLIILALLVGVRLGGVIGLFLAVPLAGAINVFVKDVWAKQNS